MQDFIMGAIAMASLVAVLFFLRFWRETGDRLFAMFSLCFLLLGISRLGLAMMNDAAEEKTYFYWLRLLAYVLILVAIVDKNRQAAGT